MPKQNTIDTNWTSGEVSPLMRGRVDSAKYANGAELIENFIVRPQGGLWKRSGARFIQKSKFSNTRNSYDNASHKSILVPFEFSDQQSYMLEFGENYIRIFKDGYPLLERNTEKCDEFNVSSNGGRMKLTAQGTSDLVSFSISAIGAYSVPGVDPYIVTTVRPHALRDGCKVYITGTGTSADNTEFTVTPINSTQFVLKSSTWLSDGVAGTVYTTAVLPGDHIYFNINAGANQEALNGWRKVYSVDAYNAFTLANYPHSGSNMTGSTADVYVLPIEIVTDYTESDLADLYFAQSADVLYICHPNYPPAKLSRLSDDGDRNDWLLADVVFKDGPYLPANSLPPNIDSTTPANGAVYDDVYFDLTSYSHTASVKSATAFAADGGDVGTDSDDLSKYIEYRKDDQWRLAQLTGSLTASGTTGAVTILDNVLLHLDEAVKLTGKPKRVVVAPHRSTQGGTTRVGWGTSGNANVTFVNSPTNSGANQQNKLDPNDALVTQADAVSAGDIKSNFSNTFGVADIGKYVRYIASNGAFKWAQIDKLYQGDGSKVHFSSPVTMASNNATGNFIIYNETRTATLTAYRNGTAFSMFSSNDVGRQIRLNFSGRWTYGIISAYSSASVVTVTLYQDPPRDPHDATKLANNGRCHTWRLGAWHSVGAGTFLGPGYPTVCCFHEQRLCFAATQTEPQTVWMSVSGDFENFIPTELDSTVLDDNAVTYTLASSKVNPIKWLESGPTLLIGTLGGEWQAKSSSATQEPITPSNIVVTPHTSHGSISTVRPQRLGYSVLFATRAGNKVRELVYDFGQDTFVAKDLTIISEHILRQGTGAYRVAFQQEPHCLYWVALNDGTLACLTFEKDQDVYAWTRHDVGGVVESLASIPSTDGKSDTIWMVVKRTINGLTERYIEILDPDFYPDTSTDNDDMFFVDAGVSVTRLSSGTTVEGLSHLEGQTVEVVCDGVRQGTEVVASGAITSDTAGTTFQVGLPYTAKVRSLPPEGGSAIGTSQGGRKTLSKLRIRVLDSLSIGHGWHGTNGAIQEENLTTGLSFWTGTYTVNLNQPWDEEAQYTLQSSKPYPLNILSVTKVINCNE